MTKQDNIFSRKDFLNLPFHHSDASIWSEVLFVTEITEEKTESWHSIELKIKDCTHWISLNLAVEEGKSKENSLFKLTTLIDHLTELRAEVEKLNPTK